MLTNCKTQAIWDQLTEGNTYCQRTPDRVSTTQSRWVWMLRSLIMLSKKGEILLLWLAETNGTTRSEKARYRHRPTTQGSHLLARKCQISWCICRRLDRCSKEKKYLIMHWISWHRVRMDSNWYRWSWKTSIDGVVLFKQAMPYSEAKTVAAKNRRNKWDHT